MTKSQIKAELRRSACEDYDPWDQVDDTVWDFVRNSVWISDDEAMMDLEDDLRIFFLLVAEAI